MHISFLGGQESPSSRSCFDRSVLGGATTGVFGFSVRSCDVLPVTSAAVRQCLSSKANTITFIGSSRTRYLYLDFAKLFLDGTPRPDRTHARSHAGVQKHVRHMLTSQSSCSTARARTYTHAHTCIPHRCNDVTCTQSQFLEYFSYHIVSHHTSHND